jgi:transposase
MSMGTRESDQSSLWVATADLPTSPGHPFYARLQSLLDAHNFDRFVEDLCRGFYAAVMGRPSLTPGRYFRLLLVGYFEGIDSERGIAWRATDSLALRAFLRFALDDPPPDHSTISRTRRLIDLETHRAVFTWVQQRLVEAGLLKGKTVAIDATTLEANAAMRSIVRRDTGEAYPVSPPPQGSRPRRARTWHGWIASARRRRRIRTGPTRTIPTRRSPK